MIYKCKPTRVEYYHNTRGKTPEAIKAETGCTAIFSGVLFNGNGSLCGPQRINGKMISTDMYTYQGYRWNNGELPVMDLSYNMVAYDNFLSCLCAICNGQPQAVNDNAPGTGGTRGRTAFGFTADGQMVVICTSDYSGAMTLSGARDTLLSESCISGIILDGGGSCYLDCPAGKVDTTLARKRANRTYVLVWEKEGENGMDRKFKVALDPGHGTGEPNCSPDKSYYEYKFAYDLSNRVKKLLEATGQFDVLLTKNSAEETPSLSERARRANEWGADIFLANHTNATATKDRDGDGLPDWEDSAHGLTVWIYALGGKRERLALRLLDQYTELGVELFGQKLYTAKFAVLAKTNMPAALIENYFHTCRGDVKKLLDSKEIDKLAYAQARGICEYFNMSDDIVPLPEPEKEVDVLKDIIYRVQVGAFADESNAQAMAETLKEQGYQTIIKTEEKR